MAAVMYDSAWPTSKQALRLCRMLENSYADALPPRLWAWGIATNNERGIFEADAKQLAEIVRYDGECEELLRAFIDCEIVEPTGKKHQFRIKGWDRNKKLFKERKRLRDVRKAQNRTRTRTRISRVQNELPVATHHVPELLVAHLSSSYSSSSSLLKNTEERTRARAQDTPSIGLGEDEPRKTEVRPTRGFPEAAFVAEFRECGKAAGIIVAEPSKLEQSIVGHILMRIGKEGITQAQVIAEWWRPEWRTYHGFDYLALDKHFAKVRAAIGDPMLRPRQRVDEKANDKPARVRPPSAEETERRDREAAEKAEPASDPESAAKFFASVGVKTGGAR